MVIDRIEANPALEKAEPAKSEKHIGQIKIAGKWKGARHAVARRGHSIGAVGAGIGQRLHDGRNLRHRRHRAGAPVLSGSEAGVRS